MSDENDSSDKELDASQRRLDQVREQGQIARSPDLITAASYVGFVLASLTMGAGALQDMGQAAASILDQADHLSGIMAQSGKAPLAGVLLPFIAALAPFFLLPMGAVLLTLVAQRGLVFTPDNLMPKLSRINPLAAAGQKFGRMGLFEFGKSAVKLTLVSIILALFLHRQVDALIGTLYLAPGQGIVVLLNLLMQFCFLVLGLAVVIGGVDLLWQHFEHLRRNRMSRQEMLEEHKDSEGDPQTKAQRRQRGYDIAMNRMLADVASADVVLVNPTHYAVALKWDRAAKRAPVCVAKGADEIAARIRERAAAAGVPMHRDPPTARALFATVDLGQEIHPDHYRAVAAAIRFAEAMRKRARR